MFELVAATTSGLRLPIAVDQLAIPLAAVCLAVALLCFKRAVAPVGPLVRALAAAATSALAVGVALVLLVAVMVQGH
ncbi:hypothetical protein [Paractinoplanes toevensis]|uniref:Uncharacterized protein n=1 Tax=Paractinoplanes toevensis TaxID=571911 RepID=A0A919W9T3_9ACTN|nr:hypothetical protein [Actinoplanes toevensis]GIM96235.1 hypothetical protein Ato02nite_080280 [Actinoplanes toevensis]